MELQSWHIPIIKVKETNIEAAFTEVKKTLLSIGLLSLAEEAQKTFRRFTEPLELNISCPLMLPPFSDLLSQPDNQILCYVRLLENPPQSPEEAQYRTFGIDLVIVSMDKAVGSQLLANFESTLQGKAISGTVREAEIAIRLKERVKEGPHAKWLGNPELNASFEILYALDLREQLGSFVETFGGSPVVGSLIEDILPRLGKVKKSEARKLISNEALFSKQFSIGCNKCGASTLAFPTREKAQEILKHSTSRKCFTCEADSLDVIETFALKEALLKGLAEGLWLEHLVHKTIEPVSVFSMAGVVVENFEIDVVSLAWENVILFECKDTSFGERDFWMSVPKAQALAADILWIVTTEPLHENVKATISKHRGQARFEILVTEKFAEQQSIVSALLEEIGKVQKQVLANLLVREARHFPLPVSFARRPIRRLPTS